MHPQVSVKWMKELCTSEPSTPRASGPDRAFQQTLALQRRRRVLKPCVLAAATVELPSTVPARRPDKAWRGRSRLAKVAELEESETAVWLVRTCDGGQPEARLIIGNSIEVILPAASWAYASGQRKRRLDAPPAAF